MSKRRNSSIVFWECKYDTWWQRILRSDLLWSTQFLKQNHYCTCIWFLSVDECGSEIGQICFNRHTMNKYLVDHHCLLSSRLVKEWMVLWTMHIQPFSTTCVWFDQWTMHLVFYRKSHLVLKSWVIHIYSVPLSVMRNCSNYRVYTV